MSHASSLFPFRENQYRSFQHDGIMYVLPPLCVPGDGATGSPNTCLCVYSFEIRWLLGSRHCDV